MMSFPFRQEKGRATIVALYGMIVAQARSPYFYSDFGVPDTVPGRIEMIVLHLVLVLRRLRRRPDPARIGQGLFDHFCRDMDDNFREMGVGDLKVPKEMRRVGAAFYGRAQAYDAALDAGDREALTEALRRNVFYGRETPAAAALADYVLRAVPALESAQPQDLEGFRFPEPTMAAAMETPR